ncbi:MAG: glutathione synthase [Acidobacteria bacterium]|nr:MAG: glutathione synthase [Acidobacteriota bacterium]REK03600.1 MAG: glutathione synthase [Acidobacteriota bacterium]
MRHLFIVDPLQLLQPEADTTIAFLREAHRRGHHTDVCQVETLSLETDARPVAAVESIAVPARSEAGAWFRSLGDRQVNELAAYDVVWMRKDPPFDQNYLYATHLLSLVPRSTLVLNDPAALRDANEKLFALQFPDFCPPTRVSRSIPELLEFRQRLGGEMVVKPLDGAGGEGVFHIRADDPNAKTILEMSTGHGRRYLMAQRFLPEVRQGDKRIILIDGEAAGAVLRVPSAGEARANFHAGGTARKTDLDERDREICAAVGPELVRRGILFAGIDVIGAWLTEINVTSPTGIREIARLDDVALEEQVLDAAERWLAARRDAAGG